LTGKDRRESRPGRRDGLRKRDEGRSEDGPHMSVSDIGHAVLNVAGMMPAIGALADAVNAGWYGLENVADLPDG
jgi:hypothetical protein